MRKAIHPRRDVADVFQLVLAQNIEVSGKAADENGAPIANGICNWKGSKKWYLQQMQW